jgi:branched-chain amino acid transport system ATP-binding protein
MVLEVIDVTVRDDGREVISNVSLKLYERTITAVLGSNGAGKSELVLAMAGMLPLVSGQIVLDGVDLARSGPDAVRAAGIAAVPEGHRVLTRLTVDENLRAAGSMLVEGVEETLNDTYALFPELAERKEQIAGTMSGGQQQMVALGHALMSRPRFILIDEMSLGLAPLVVKRLMRFVETLRDRGVGVLLIEQFTDMALNVSEQAIVLRAGIARYDGRAEALLQNKSLLDQAYFGIEEAEMGAHVGV